MRSASPPLADNCGCDETFSKHNLITVDFAFEKGLGMVRAVAETESVLLPEASGRIPKSRCPYLRPINR